MMTPLGDWLTINEAAKLSGYHPEHLRELVREGKIDARKFGTVWALNRESLLDFIHKTEELGEKRGRKPRK